MFKYFLEVFIKHLFSFRIGCRVKVNNEDNVKMVILLEEEITEYEPYGRLVISSLPGHRSCLSTATTTRQQQAQDVTQELEDELTLSNKLFSNLTLNPNFTIAELDGTRDLFRSPTDVSNAKDMSASFPVSFVCYRCFVKLSLFSFRRNFGEFAKVVKAKRSCLFREIRSFAVIIKRTTAAVPSSIKLSHSKR